MTVEIAALRRAVEAQTDKIAELTEAVAVRDRRIAELEKLLDDSRRSGKRQAAPFSKGAPSDEPARPGRRSGDDHGRHGHRSVPVRFDRELRVPLPRCCPDCGEAVIAERTAEQFQTDLPAMPAPVVTRFEIEIGRCGGCGKRVQGRHGEQTSDALGAAGAQIGPNAKAWAAWLHYGLGLSFAKCAQLLGRLGVEVTPGAICTAAQSMGAALAPVKAEIIDKVNAAEAITMDETGWRVEGLNAWLWVATTNAATVYNVAAGRGFDQACELVGVDYGGVIIRDGWAPYRHYLSATHQSCVAHVLRRAHELQSDLPGWARGTPGQIADLLHAILDARGLDPDQQTAAAEHFVEMIELLYEQAHPHDENRKFVKHLYNERHALVAFLRHADIEATNWRGEQAIRPAVVNRKVWGGNRTWRGATTQGTITSVIRTAVQQGVDAIEFLARHARSPDPACVSLFA